MIMDDKVNILLEMVEDLRHWEFCKVLSMIHWWMY